MTAPPLCPVRHIAERYQLWFSPPCSGGPAAVRRFTATGFTLVEMLAAIAIIALLLSLLLPTLSRSKVEARKAQCLSNLRQIALAIEVYTTDNEQRFPSNYDGMAGRELVPNWAYGNMADSVDRRDGQSLTTPRRSLLAPYL